MFKTLLFTLFLSLSLAAREKEFSFSTITADEPTSSEITRDSFSLIVARVYAINAPAFVKQGLVVELGLDWQMPYLTAFVKELGAPRYSLNFWGGLARVPGMNEEAWALVACHEAGHLIGGAPYSRLNWNPWSSAEGQCDYFAASECIKRYRRTYQLQVPINSSCAQSFDNEEAILDCSFTMKAAEGFAKMLEYLTQYREHFQVETPDPLVVSETNYNSYPSSQCRVDTIVAGAFCELIEGSASCESEASKRPACWYAR